MIVVRITMNVLPEKQKELIQTILSMVGSMENAEGCLSYALFCNLEDSNLLNLLEEWQTRKDLDQHLRSDMFGVLLGTKSLLDRTAWDSDSHDPSIGGHGSRSCRSGEIARLYGRSYAIVAFEGLVFRQGRIRNSNGKTRRNRKNRFTAGII